MFSSKVQNIIKLETFKIFLIGLSEADKTLNIHLMDLLH